ncbi:MAG: phytanoyl-CoA dioxygenase family protein [Nisaea sp.]|uniref:phytanoyl-CoA dioxygenase family protein n=1 Tax=Nisaea sp. TaxID=2024842 RepID=UPI001B106D32|nr:phytanoyl-CoA dioxygenase family protein [Nisaea sp.]MBO6560639.1 phytanoyl-CoA dioxygenase family protein [Nisaea sp.]
MSVLETAAAASVAESFARDGFVCPITVMSPAEAAGYRRQLEASEAEYGADKTFRKMLRRYPNLVLPFIDEITRRPEITDVVAEILGPDLLVLDAPFFIKEANTKSFVSWHQDLHYWGLESEEEVTAWVALSPATAESGCMRFVAGSQNRRVDHRDTYAEDNLLTRGQELAVEVDEREATDAALEPGQMSIHHGRVFHASHPNRTDDRRIGLAIRYIPARARQTEGGNMAAMLVRGEDRYGNFHACRPPTGLMTEADIAHWTEIAGARNKVMLGGKTG